MPVTRPQEHWLVRVFVACVLAAWSAPTLAQTFYKWTDDKGIVHFADMPPSRPQGVEERTLRVPPVVSKPANDAEAVNDGDTANGDQAKATDADAAAGAAGSGAAKATGTGPAKVIMLSSKDRRTGPSSVHITGEVKNVGGEDAQNVAITVVALDVTQGTPCLEEETEVTPGKLGPGQTGNFDVDLNNPCLFGEANVNTKPVWE